MLDNFRLGTFAWDLSLVNFRLGHFAWELSLGLFRLGTFAGDISLGNFRLGSFAWKLSLGNFRLGIIINNVKNMRGEVEGWWEDFLWNPIGSVFGIGRALKL